MKTKIIYVLSSDNEDFYLEELLISVYSLRLHNSTAVVELVVDEATASTLIGKRATVKDYINEIHTIKVPDDYNKMQVSRYLKTSLRQYIDGDYLYMDTDTIVCESLEGLDEIECEIGAVLDMYGIAYFGESKKWDVECTEKMGWAECLEVDRFNGGVLFVRDNQNTSEFYKLWHLYWKQCLEKGINIDQLSLRKAQSKLPIIREIDSVWNCQPETYFIGAGKKLQELSYAKICHYWGFTEIPHIRTNELWAGIKRTGTLPNEIIEAIGKDPRKNIMEKLLMFFYTKYRGTEPFEKTATYSMWQYYPRLFMIIEYLSRILVSLNIHLLGYPMKHK